MTNLFACVLLFKQLLRLLKFIFLISSIACSCGTVLSETLYPTGLQAERGRLAAAPDGKRLVFTTNRPAHGMRLLDTESGRITSVPNPSSRNLTFPSWSPDGKNLAVVSTEIRDGSINFDDMKIVLLDTTTWHERVLVSGEGVKYSPFFSTDGKSLYYFKGQKRDSGRTVASRFELFVTALESGQQTKLTDEAFYEINRGDDDGISVLFGTFLGVKNRYQGYRAGNYLMSYNKATGSLAPVKVDQSSGIFNFYSPQRDKEGNLYFEAAKERPGGGNYLWFLFTSAPDGSHPSVLTALPIGCQFDIAKNTGEIYVMDMDRKELTIRRLTTLAAH